MIYPTEQIVQVCSYVSEPHVHCAVQPATCQHFRKRYFCLLVATWAKLAGSPGASLAHLDLMSYQPRLSDTMMRVAGTAAEVFESAVDTARSAYRTPRARAPAPTSSVARQRLRAATTRRVVCRAS